MAVKKLYTEGYIADIAEAIRAKNGSDTTYTTAEMSAAISALVGPDEFIKNNISSIKRSTFGQYLVEQEPSGIVFHPDSQHFYCLPSNGKVNAGLAFNYTNKKFVPTGIQFQFDVGYRGMYWPDHGKEYLLTGIQKSYPLMIGDLSTVSNNIEDNHFKFDSINNTDMLDIPVQLINMHPTYTHPLLLEAYANERTMSFNDFFSTYSEDDIFNVISKGFISPKYYGREYPITRGYIFVSGNNLLVITPNEIYNGEIMYDGEKLVVTSDTYGDRYTNISTYKYDKHTIDLNAAHGKRYIDPYLEDFTDAQSINAGFIYSTEDIKDTNNNVLFEANVSLSEFSSWINWEQ